MLNIFDMFRPTSVAIKTMTEGARYLREDDNFDVFQKIDGSQVTNVDMWVETYIKAIIRMGDTGKYNFVCEESGIDKHPDAMGTVFIDPIDGTSNLIKGKDHLPNVWISVAFSDCYNTHVIPQYGIVFSPWRDVVLLIDRSGFSLHEIGSNNPVMNSEWSNFSEAYGLPARVGSTNIAGLAEESERVNADRDGIRTGSIVDDLFAYVTGSASSVYNNHANIWDIAAFMPMMYHEKFKGMFHLNSHGYWTVDSEECPG